MLEVKNLKTYFRTPSGIARIVDDVSFKIPSGKTLALVGESGCGKSITALSLIQLIPKHIAFFAGGKVLFKGKNLLKLSQKERQFIRGNRISMIFQDPMKSLNPVFSIGFQIMEPLRLHQRLSLKEARDKTIELLDMVKIGDPQRIFSEYPHQLSGGMKQRVMIAIAMACNPDILIADEPTTALDVTTQRQILNLLRDIQEKSKMSILLITHDMGLVSRFSDEVAVMYAGKIVELAKNKNFFSHTSHPYSIKLLRSIPAYHNPKYYLETIEGRVPPAEQYPEVGCSFSERCHVKEEICGRETPVLLKIKPGHQTACHLYAKKFQKSNQAIHSLKQNTLKPSSSTAPKKNHIKIRSLKVYYPIKKGILKKTVGHVKAVDGVDINIRKGSTFALVGESGCGKTTFGKAIVKLAPVWHGNISIESQEITSLKEKEMQKIRKKVQIIFQDPFSSLNPRIMIKDIISEGIKAHFKNLSKKEVMKKIDHALKIVGLSVSMKDRYPHEFSGGQRQRIGIARVLVLDPDFIVCDEVTSSLDVSVQAQILNLLEKLQHELNLTYLFITHDLGLVKYLADEVAVMHRGKIVETGTTNKIFNSPQTEYTKELLSMV